MKQSKQYSSKKQTFINLIYIIYLKMAMYKLRVIGSRNKGHPSSTDVYGITVPNKYVMFFEGVHFNLEKSGTSLIFTSGASNVITKQQIEEYKYENCNTI